MEWGASLEEETRVEIDPLQLGTLELGDAWVPYVDLYDSEFMPAEISVLDNTYRFTASFLVKGHGATMPQLIRALRQEGKRPLVVERSDRYYVFASAA